MLLKVDSKIFQEYPKVILGVAVLDGIDNKGNNPEIQNLLREAEQLALQNLGDTPIVEHPHIALWREVYRTFGAKPKKYPSSIENMLRRVAKGDLVRHINKLVDIYNVISLKYLVPVGGEDIDKINGNVLLTFANEKEDPVVLLGEKEARTPYFGEVIYKDDTGTICRRWNWKEADRTKLTEDTENAVIVIEGLPPVDRGEIQTALDDLSSLVKEYCGGKILTSILDKNNPQVVLK